MKKGLPRWGDMVFLVGGPDSLPTTYKTANNAKPDMKSEIGNNLLPQVEKFVFGIIGTSNALSFHNYQHTRDVVASAREIAKAEVLSEDELQMLIIAAWFHDTGFSIQYYDHEEASKKIADKYLKSIGYPNIKIRQVLNLIDATKTPQSPHSKLEKVICDADLYHLSTDNYASRRNQLRREWKNHLGKVFSDEDWFVYNLHFIKQHTFFTKYGRDVLEHQKLSNIQEMSEKLELISCK